MTKRLFLAGALVTGILLAVDEVTIPLDFGEGGPLPALTIHAKPMQASRSSPIWLDHWLAPCPAAWCIAYEIRRVGGTEMKTIHLKLQFDVGGLCSKKPSQWSNQTEDRFDDLQTISGFPVDDTKGCTVELLKVTLISAMYGASLLAHNEAPEIDFTDALKAIQARRDVEEARRKGLAAERKQKEAAEAASLAKIKAAEDAKAAEDLAKTRAACSAIYQNTIDKKVKDLTVREDQQIQACRALGLYPPH